MISKPSKSGEMLKLTIGLYKCNKCGKTFRSAEDKEKITMKGVLDRNNTLEAEIMEATKKRTELEEHIQALEKEKASLSAEVDALNIIPSLEEKASQLESEVSGLRDEKAALMARINDLLPQKASPPMEKPLEAYISTVTPEVQVPSAVPILDAGAEVPTIEAPKVEVSIIEAPIVEALEVPIIEVPTFEVPTEVIPVKSSVSDALIVDAPAVEVPTVEVLTADVPTLGVTTVEAPIVEAPISEDPVSEVPAVNVPIAEPEVVSMQVEAVLTEAVKATACEESLAATPEALLEEKPSECTTQEPAVTETPSVDLQPDQPTQVMTTNEVTVSEAEPSPINLSAPDPISKAIESPAEVNVIEKLIDTQPAETLKESNIKTEQITTEKFVEPRVPDVTQIETPPAPDKVEEPIQAETATPTDSHPIEVVSLSLPTTEETISKPIDIESTPIIQTTNESKQNVESSTFEKPNETSSAEASAVEVSNNVTGVQSEPDITTNEEPKADSRSVPKEAPD